MTSSTATPDQYCSNLANPQLHLCRFSPSAHPDRQIRYGVVASPWGQCLLATTAYGICHLSLLSAMSPALALADLRREWPDAMLSQDQAAMAALAVRVFAATPMASASGDPLRVIVRATDFQWAVWQAVLGIPCGSRSSYGEIAAVIGSPRASRAVGTAIGTNPVAWLIPCHRVVPKNGGLGGYRWGVECKRKLLAGEGVPGVTGNRPG